MDFMSTSFPSKSQQALYPCPNIHINCTYLEGDVFSEKLVPVTSSYLLKSRTSATGPQPATGFLLPVWKNFH